MLKEQARLVTSLSIIADSTIVLLAFVLSYSLRGCFDPPLFPLTRYAWTLLIILPTWMHLMERQKLFSSLRHLRLRDLFFRLGKVHLWGVIVVAAIVFFIDRDLFSRSLLLIFALTAFIFLLLEKGAVRLGLGFLRRRGYNFRQVLIVGTSEKALNFHRLLDHHADWGLRIVGYVQVAPPPLMPDAGGFRVLGHIDQLIELAKKYPVDEVVFCLQKDFVGDAEKYVQELEKLGVTSRMVMDIYQMDRSRREISLLDNQIPILTFHTKNIDGMQLLLKRMFDIGGACIGLLLTACLFPFIALAITLDSPGPVFFRQKRVGERGRVFRCWKFRTMKVDAARQKRLLADRNEMSGAIFKVRHDPRVTRVGRFLRVTSLDELPQFWNVLRGEMSLVGTRPPTPGEVKHYQNWHHRRISIKPGITGMWQVSGRSNIREFDEIVRLDLDYIDAWSFWLDLQILLKTVAVVFARRGSC